MHICRCLVLVAISLALSGVTTHAQPSISSSPPALPLCGSLALPDVVIPDAVDIGAVVDCAYEFSDGNDHSTATRLFKVAIDTATRRGDLKGLARALNGSGNELTTFGGGEGAEALFLESGRVSEQAGDKNGMARAASSLGGLRTSQARYEEARVYHLRSLELWTDNASESGMATALNNVGGAYRALGDFATALDYFQRSLDSLTRQGDRRRSATVLDNMGIVARRLGDYTRGLELAQQGLAIRESVNDREGNWGAALAALGKSLDIRREFGFTHATAEALNNIAVVYEAQGSYGQAVASLRQALALNREKVGSASLTAEIQTHLGEVFLLEGQLARSTQALKESVAISDAENYHEQSASAHYALGRTYVADRRPTAARVEFEKCLVLRERLGDRGGRAWALIELGDLDRRQGRLTRGRERAEEARALAASTELPDAQWRALTLIGRLQLAAGHRRDARGSFDAAIALVEDIRRRNPGGQEMRSRFFADRIAPFQERIALSVDEGHPAEALGFAERSKARALLDVLRDNGTGVTRAMTAEERSREVALRTSLNGASSALEVAARSTSPDEVHLSNLRRARDRTRLEYEAFLSRLYADHPSLQISRADLPRITAADAQKLVQGPDSAILEFVLGADRTFVIVVSTTGVRVKPDHHSRRLAVGASLPGAAVRSRTVPHRRHRHLVRPVDHGPSRNNAATN